MLRTRIPVRCLQSLINTSTSTFIRHRSSNAKVRSLPKLGQVKPESIPKQVSPLMIDPDNIARPFDSRTDASTPTELLIGDFVEVFK
jgi:hypothetical protein